ncbi:hypothetical protein, partial [Ferrimicrobium acidiphilum]|uniref:hypothetical protein n=1 Tax=Ferrimicrobium acidiphilum TaxID=121039 RepID=UPI0023F0454A
MQFGIRSRTTLMSLNSNADLRKSAVIRHQDRPGIDKSLSASEVIGQIGTVMWRVLNYTTRER